MSAEQLKQRDAMQRLTDFLNEVGMLRHTPRSGYNVSWGPAKKPWPNIRTDGRHRLRIGKKDGSGRGPHGHALPLP